MYFVGFIFAFLHLFIYATRDFRIRLYVTEFVGLSAAKALTR